MLLVDNDQAEGGDGGEDGGARADDNTGAALTDLVPFVMALAGGEVAVEDGDEGPLRAAGETGLETLDGLWRQRYFRHEDDGAPAHFQGAGDGLQIDFGLAAAGDAVEEEGGAFRSLQGGDDFRQGALLLAVHDERLRGQNGFAGVGVALGNLRGDGEKALVLQFAHHLGGGAGGAQEFLHLPFGPGTGQVESFLLTFGEFDGVVRRQGAHEQLLAPAGLFAADGVGERGLQGCFRRATIITGDPAGELEDGGGGSGPAGR